MVIHVYILLACVCRFFFSSRRRHTRFDCDWSSDVCSSDLCAGILTSHPQGRELDGVEDLRIAGAPAEISGEGVLDLLPRRARTVGEKRRGGEENTGRAVPALGGAQLGKGLLERVEAAALRHPFDRRDPASLRLDGQGEARQYGLAVDEHGT